LSFAPSTFTALPKRPVVHIDPFISVPLRPCPDESAVVVPEPSSNA